MPTQLELTKLFQVSKLNAYFDGDPMPYMVSVKIPVLMSPTEDFDNTSTGGKVTIADGARKESGGPGEMKLENLTAASYVKLLDATRVVSLKIPTSINALNPQNNRFMPYPMKYSIAAQFFDLDEGELKNGGKRDITAKFNMFSYKVEINNVLVVDFDMLSSEYILKGADILSSIKEII